jgi:hypothetical protein
MPNNQIDINIRANDQSAAGIESAKAKILSFETAQRQALSAHREDLNRAKGAAELLGQQFGLHIPRELRSLMASTSGVGAVMSAAFAPAAILALIPIVTELAGKISEISDAFDESAASAEDFGAAAQKAMRDTVETAKAFRDATREGELIGLSPQEAALRRAQFKRDEASKLNPQIEFRRQQLADLLKEKTELPREQLVTGVGVTIKAPASVVPAVDTAKAIKVVQTEINNLLDRQRALLKEADNTWQGYKESGTAASKAVAAALETADKDVAAMLANLSKFSDSKFDTQLRAVDEAIAKAAEVQRQHPEAYSLANETIARLMKERTAIITAENNAIIDSMRLTDTEMLKGLDKLMQDLQNEKKQNLPQDPMKATQVNLQGMSDRMLFVQNVSNEMSRSFQSAFAGILAGTETVGSGFARMAEQIAAAVAAAVAQMLVMKLVMTIIGAAFGGMGGMGGMESITGGAASLSLGGISGIRDAGGPVTAGQSYMIGLNRMPEIFTPTTSGTITPLSKVGSGAAPSVVINNNTGSPMEATPPRFDGEKWWVDVFTKQMMTNGPVRQMLKGGR